MQTEATEQTKIVKVRFAIKVLLQSNDGFVTFQVGRQADANTAYGVLQDSVDEKPNVCYTRTNPLGIGSLSNCPLQDILFVDAFEKRFERLDIRHQAWLIKVSTAAVTR